MKGWFYYGIIVAYSVAFFGNRICSVWDASKASKEDLVVPGFFMFTKKEMSVKEAIIREIVQGLIITVIIVAFVMGGKEPTAENIVIAIGVAISVPVVYIGVLAISYFLDLKTAKRLTDELKEYQENNRMTD